ncbi:MAG TPA: FKBP-type peptidyl-prolyl cis-trans isomerase [Flavisolibacter sp.]|jgi:FKBP-type peptidyl-prolyl cis-trans isomerase FklB|nr:FKBP-type peptidyl-prolyl cis-trans isomerase [Flavisolibacter sp.]
MGLFDKLQSSRSEKLQSEKDAGIAFMAENRTKEGITELPSGIQYQVVKEGNGPKPSPTSKVKAHYRGSLLDGKEFDSSFKRNQPFTAGLTQLIKGWQDVLPLMPVGSTWRLWIPSHLAYGDNGTGGIPGGATLIFDIELLEIVS